MSSQTQTPNGGMSLKATNEAMAAMQSQIAQLTAMLQGGTSPTSAPVTVPQHIGNTGNTADGIHKRADGRLVVNGQSRKGSGTRNPDIIGGSIGQYPVTLTPLWDAAGNVVSIMLGGLGKPKGFSLNALQAIAADPKGFAQLLSAYLAKHGKAHA